MFPTGAFPDRSAAGGGREPMLMLYGGGSRQRNGKYVGRRREVLAGMAEAPPHHSQVGREGQGWEGPCLSAQCPC